MKRYYALTYTVADEFLRRRGEFRKAHLKKVFEAHAKGELILGGALGDPTDRVLLIFRANDKTIPERFAKADPYVLNELVKTWEVSPWSVVAGLQTGDFDPLEGQPELKALHPT